jgi:hypothetical protein
MRTVVEERLPVRRAFVFEQSFFVTYLLVSAMFAVGLATLHFDRRMALMPAAFLFGWTQIGGLCGAAHINTMGCFLQRSRKLWFQASLAYTLFGLLSATTTGLVLGWAGSQVNGRTDSLMLWVMAFLSLLLAMREMGWLEFRLPERRCQTERSWAYQFSHVTAAAMWGFHIGLGFFTVITYGGFWALVSAIVAVGQPVYGAFLMGAYWFGRSLPLWVVPPFFYSKPLDAQSIYPLFRPIQALGLAWSGLVAVLMIFGI